MPAHDSDDGRESSCDGVRATARAHRRSRRRAVASYQLASAGRHLQETCKAECKCGEHVKHTPPRAFTHAGALPPPLYYTHPELTGSFHGEPLGAPLYASAACVARNLGTLLEPGMPSLAAGPVPVHTIGMQAPGQMFEPPGFDGQPMEWGCAPRPVPAPGLSAAAAAEQPQAGNLTPLPIQLRYVLPQWRSVHPAAHDGMHLPHAPLDNSELLYDTATGVLLAMQPGGAALQAVEELVAAGHVLQPAHAAACQLVGRLQSVINGHVQAQRLRLLQQASTCTRCSNLNDRPLSHWHMVGVLCNALEISATLRGSNGIIIDHLQAALTGLSGCLSLV